MTLEDAKDLNPNHAKWNEYFQALQVLRQALKDRCPEYELHYDIKILEGSKVVSILKLGPYEVEVEKTGYVPSQSTVLRLHQLMLKKLEQEFGPREVQRLRFS